MIEYGYNFDLDVIWARRVGDPDADEIAEQFYAQMMGWA